MKAPKLKKFELIKLIREEKEMKYVSFLLSLKTDSLIHDVDIILTPDEVEELKKELDKVS